MSIKREVSASNIQQVESRKIGSLQILRTINDNVYTVDLSNTMYVSKTFGILDIYKYDPKEAVCLQWEN